MEVATTSMARTVQRTRPRRAPADKVSGVGLLKAVVSAMLLSTADMPFSLACMRDPAPLPKPHLRPTDARRSTSPEKRNPCDAPYRAAQESREMLGYRRCNLQ